MWQKEAKQTNKQKRKEGGKNVCSFVTQKLYITQYNKTCRKSQEQLLRYRAIKMQQINTKQMNFQHKY